MRPWPGSGMYVHFAALGVLAIMLAAGVYYRFAAGLFFLGFTYVFLIDQAYYLNHFYLIALLAFLMIFVPAHTYWSVDSWRHPALRSPFTPAWAVWLLRFQMGIPYFFGGMAKLNSDWLSGEPMRLWLASRGSFPLLGAIVHEPWCPYLFSYGGLLLDLLAVPLLLYRRTVFLAFGLLATFHLLNAVLFQIGVFPGLMLAGTLILYWPFARDARDEDPLPTRPLPLASIAALAVFVALQVLVPLRHFLYPGNVNWTEEGHRFSWHMKLRDKESVAHFFVTDLDTHAEWEVEPEQHLTRDQARMMSERPDMLLQFAHYLAAVERQRHARVAVRASVMTSLNGRRYQPLVNPSVDLAAQPRNLWTAAWILPLDEPLPYRAPGASPQWHPSR